MGDRRGLGDIRTLTTEEYAALGPGAQRLYHLYRHPLVMLVIGPPLLFILRQRTTYKVPAAWQEERRSVLCLDRSTGKILWDSPVHVGKPVLPKNGNGTQASSTVACGSRSASLWRWSHRRCRLSCSWSC